MKEQLELAGFVTVFQTLPDPINARAQYWLPYLKDHIAVTERDVLVGWSSGATAAMRFAERNRILGSLLISPHYTDLGSKFERQSGYFDDPWNWNQIRSNQVKSAIVYGLDDPYIDQDEFCFIRTQLGAHDIPVPEGRHFAERATLPEGLAYLLKEYANT